MKKTITLFRSVLLFTALMVGSVSYAQSIEQDFAKNEGWTPALPTAATATESTHTFSNGKTWRVFNTKWSEGYQGGTNYIAPQKSTGYVVLPIMEKPVGSVEVTTGSSASTTVEISLFAGTLGTDNNITWEGNAIESKTLDKKNETFTYILTNQKAGVIYKLAVTNNKNAQFSKIKINEASTEPSVAFRDNADVPFGTGLNGTQTKTINIIGANLATVITASLEGTDAAKFALDITTIAKEGGDVKVTYTGSTAAAATATLKIASGNATATIELKGNTVQRAGTKEDPFTVSDVIALNNATEGTYWVKGIIAGSADNGGGIAATPIASNIALSQPNIATAIPVALPSGPIRTALSLVENPTNLNKEIKVYGELVSYFSYSGVKNLTDYELSTDPSGISSEQVNSAIYSSNGIVYVQAESGERIIVSNVAGQVIVNIAAGAGITPIDNLPAKQLLIVKAGDKVTKIIL